MSAGEGGVSHEDIVNRVATLEGRVEERIRSADRQFDHGRERMSAIEERIGGLEIGAARTVVTLEIVRATGQRTEEKVDKLVGILDQGKGAVWAILTVRRVAWLLVATVASVAAWFATDWAAVKKFLGIGN